MGTVPRHLAPMYLYLFNVSNHGGRNSEIAHQVIRDLDRERLFWRSPPPRHRKKDS